MAYTQCSQISAGINARCDTSMGGIIEVAIANYEPAIFKFDESDKKVAANLAAELKWYGFRFRKGTSSMTSTLNIDDANGVNYVSTELTMIFGKMDTEKRLAIAGLAAGEVVAVVKDANGKYWALGYDEPVTASAGEGVTGTARGDGNHYSITLLDNSTTFPYEVGNGAAVFDAIQEA